MKESMCCINVVKNILLRKHTIIQCYKDTFQCNCTTMKGALFLSSNMLLIKCGLPQQNPYSQSYIMQPSMLQTEYTPVNYEPINVAFTILYTLCGS